MGRPHSALLSQEKIAEAALRLIDNGERFGMRQVARELGVSTPSLYNYVASRADLIDLVRSTLDSPADQHAISTNLPWYEQVRLLVKRVHRAHASHPALIPLLLTSPIATPRVLASYEQLAAAISSGGFDDLETRTYIDMLDSFSLGTALQLSSTQEIWRSAQPGGPLARAMMKADYGPDRVERAFDMGLRTFIEAMRAAATRKA